MTKPLAIDLFSGCGGLTLGLRQAGFRVIGAVECDPLAVETYKANHDHVHVWARKIEAVTVAEVKRKLKLCSGRLDLLAACPPCQGFSAIKTLNGCKPSDDPRNELIFQLLRFVRGLRPKAVMMENVPGLLNDRRVNELVVKLEQAGYRCTLGVLDAAEYGVPQRRRRFMLLAGRGKKLAFARRARRRRTVREAFARLGKRAKRDPLHAFSREAK